MCAEGAPLDCHRFSMISVYLDKQGIEVKHIMKDGSLKTNKEIESDLLLLHRKKLPESDLFDTITKEDKIKEAYRLQNKKIGWSRYQK